MAWFRAKTDREVGGPEKSGGRGSGCGRWQVWGMGFGIAGNSHHCPSGMGESVGARRGQSVTVASFWSSSLTQSPRFGEMRKVQKRKTDSRGYLDWGALNLSHFSGKAS